MLQKINIYIFGQIIRAIAFALLALVGMFWIGKAIPLIELVILRGETSSTFFRLSSYLLPSIIKIMLPIAIMIAVIFTLNRMANDGEILSIHNSGRNPMRILIPIAQIGVFFVIISAIISLWLVPSSLYGIRSDLDQISQNYSKNIITAQKFMNPDQNLYIYVEDSILSGEMINIFIDDRRSEESTRTYFAERALLVKEDGLSKLALIVGNYHERNIKTGQVSVGNFNRLEIGLDLNEAASSNDEYSLEEMPTQNLIARIKQKLETHEKDSKAIGELVDRLAFPLLNFLIGLMSALGFLVSAFSRHGYKKAITFGVISGLCLEAYTFSLKDVISNNSVLLFLMLIPFIIVAVALLFTNRFVSGYKK